jgi:hypothetical protein
MFILQNGRKRIARLALRYGANINHQVASDMRDV